MHWMTCRALYTRPSLGVLVGHDGAHGLHDRLGGEVLRRDQLQPLPLPPLLRGTDGQCSPRQRMPAEINKRGFKVCLITWRAPGLIDSARRVRGCRLPQELKVKNVCDNVKHTIHETDGSARHNIECHLTQNRSVHIACDDVASTLHQSLPSPSR
jgi:hypothetical protein